MQYLKKPPKEDPNELEDHFQMMLRYAQKERPSELNIQDIGTRIMTTNFGSMHQTAAAATNVLLNVLDSDQEYNTISILRAEISRVLTYFNGVWSRAAAAKMIRCDSVLRETLRLHAFAVRSMPRKVMVDNIETEDDILLPKGSDVSILTLSVQTDGELFEDPFRFDPFRYSRIREAAAKADKEASSIKVPFPSLSFVSTGTHFLPFGHGKHSCPGRYLVDFELKMILAYTLLNYDLEFPEEYGGKRPPVTWMAEVLMPPKEAKIRVRRRARA
jgi:cytochrome P450